MFFCISSAFAIYWYSFFSFFFFNDTATTEIYTLSLHDALPIFQAGRLLRLRGDGERARHGDAQGERAAGSGSDGPVPRRDRKSTRLNSSHTVISYAVFCLKKKKKKNKKETQQKQDKQKSGQKNI